MDGQKRDLSRETTVTTVDVIVSTFLTFLIEFFGGGGVRHSSQDPRMIPLASGRGLSYVANIWDLGGPKNGGDPYVRVQHQDNRY